jgi:hypothetical protein
MSTRRVPKMGWGWVSIVGKRVIGGGRTKSSKIGWVESFQIVGDGLRWSGGSSRGKDSLRECKSELK